MSFNNTSDISNSNNEVSSLPFSLKELEDNDYKFTYQIKENNSITSYKGLKSNNKIDLNYNSNNYTFTYTSGELNVNDNVKYSRLLDIYTIKKIIKNSKLVSDTRINETGDIFYNYTVSNNYLNSVFENNVNDNLVNDITVKTNNLKVVYEIDFNLLNYEKSIDSNLYLLW